MGKLISVQRVINEELEWQDVQIELEEPLVDEWSGVTHSHALDMRIIDAQGVVYHGIIEDDGRVTAFGGYCHFDSVKTYESFGAAEEAGIYKRYGRGKTRHYLYFNRETGEIFGRASHPNVSDERFYSMDACDVAAWLSDIDNREEPIIYDTDPRSIAIGLPIEIVDAIEGQLPGNAIDWIRCILAEAVGDITRAGAPVGSGGESADPRFTTEQVEEAITKMKSRAVVDKMKPRETKPERNEPRSGPA
jgi:hypothetical protein